MIAASSSRSDHDVRLLALLSVCVSVISFLFYYRHGDVLLYGDAVAHINIARRVFDSKTPGLLQLGTVWLPLPHLLILPFVVSQQLWQGGAGGSIPSMAAYVFGVLGIFRLVRGALGGDVSGRAVRIAAWTAALIYGANPNLLYMQSTAMGEAIYLALFIWAVVYFSEFAGGDAGALTKCGLCIAGACLTRYDGWFLAGVVIVAVIGRLATAHGERSGRSAGQLRAAVAAGVQSPPSSKPTPDAAKGRLFQPVSGRALAKFFLLAAAGPVLWLAYNAAVYRNPLEFATGPHSARAIEKRTNTINPTKNNLYAAGSYFLKAAELNMAEAGWQGRLWLLLALFGSLVAWFLARARTALPLWVPLPFYALSVAYGSVPIFVPPWWPFTHYNVRYGLQLLPAFAVFIALAIAAVVDRAAKLRLARDALRARGWASAVGALAILLLVGDSYFSIWRGQPICYQEAAVNMRGRVALEKQLAELMQKLPPDSTLLMYLGDHVGALQRAGIPLRRVINEGNHRVWKQPEDPDGLWERALADPASHADYVIAFEGDRVWQAVQARNLTALVELHATGQPRAVIYQARTR